MILTFILLVMAAMLFFMPMNAQAQQTIKVQFTQPSEVVSTIMYLSGAEEYTWCEMSDYLKDVDIHFASLKNHEAVQLVKKLHNGGFCYDKPMAFALRLEVKDGHIVAKKNILRDKEGYLSKWDSKHEKTLIRLVDDFYQQSHFNDFYTAHQMLYDKAVAAMHIVVDKIDEGWYDRHFGPQENSSFEVVTSLLNGPANYASTIHWRGGHDTYYATMGCCSPDSLGNPVYPFEQVLAVVIHERNHAYCNPLNDIYWKDLKDKATEVFQRHPTFYCKAAYNKPELVMDETFVEASVVQYLREHNYEIADLYYRITQQKERYYLVPTMLEAFQQRNLQHSKYPTMQSFMPEMIKMIYNFPLPEPIPESNGK